MLARAQQWKAPMQQWSYMPLGAIGGFENDVLVGEGFVDSQVSGSRPGAPPFVRMPNDLITAKERS